MAENVSVSGNLDVNFDGLNSAAETFKQANDKFKSGPQSTFGGGAFNALTTPEDFLSAYLDEVNQSITDILQFADKHYAGIVELALPDAEEAVPTDPSTSITTGGGGSGGGSGSGSGGSDGGDSSPTNPPETNPSNEIKPLDTSLLNDLSLQDLDGVVDSLKDMAENAEKGIDEILADEALADKLKELLLASQNIPDEFKELLKNASSEVVRQAFVSIMKGENPEVFDLNPLNIGALYTYLMSIANENGITVEELLSNEKYANILKEKLSEFGDVVDLLKEWDSLSAEEYQAKLLQIYDGDEIGEVKTSTVNIVRNFVEHISETTEISAEELLTDSKYAEIVKKAAQEFGKTAVFAEATSNYSEEGMRETVGNLFNGKNAKALGMDDSDVAGFKSEIDSLAKSKGVTATELLTDSTYADDVKNALNDSKNASEVGSIYSKAESTVSQNVANNLYNTKDSTTTTDSTTTSTTTTSESSVTSSS